MLIKFFQLLCQPLLRFRQNCPQRGDFHKRVKFFKVSYHLFDVNAVIADAVF